MRAVDPRLAKAERLLTKVLQLFEEIRSGPPAPPRRRKRHRRPKYRRAAILEALREGATTDVPTADRDPRLPCKLTLRRYCRRDAALDAEVRSILRTRPRPARTSARKVRPIAEHPPFYHATVLGLIHGGAALGASPPVPGMPTKAALDQARREDRTFNAAVVQAIAEARKHRCNKARQLRRPGLAGRVDWEAVACEIEGGASIHKKSKNRGSLPTESLIHARAKADPAFAARIKRVSDQRCRPRRPFDFDEVLERVRNGAQVDARSPEPGMPSRQAMRRMRRKDPTFNRAVIAALAEARRRKANRGKLRMLGREAPWTLVQAAVPRTLPQDVRDDVVGELTVRLLSGIVGPVAEELAIAWKACRAKLTGHRWMESSLNSPIAGTDGLTRLDLLADDAVRF